MMFKSWIHVCVLVLALLCLSKGQDANATEEPYNDDQDSETTLPDAAVNKTELNTLSPQRNTSRNGTEDEKVVDNIDDFYDFDNSTNGNISSTSETSTAVSEPTTEEKKTKLPPSQFSTSTPSVTTKAAPTGGSSWAYVILVLIILVIIVLCIILYLLRRASRSYTFDLQRPVPSNNLNEPTGTFEQVYLDDLEQTAPKFDNEDEVITDDVLSTQVANGTTVQSEQDSDGDSASLNHPDSNGVDTSPFADIDPSPSDEHADNDSTNSTNLFFDAVGVEQQNENNNNPYVRFNDPFVEINLGDPALCNQSSSVLPFSSFHFSSS